MTMSDILAVLGILATVLFGIWGLVVVLRRRYPSEISFVREPHLALFETIIKNLPELTAQYDKKPVGPGLVLVRGALLNSGSKDISDPMVEGKLTFSLPERFKWWTAKIVGASPDVKASVAVEERRLTFSTGLFRCSEFIRFQAIAEVPLTDPDGDGHSDAKITELLNTAIKIEHRIADTRSVAVIDLPSARTGKQRLDRLMELSLVNTAMVIVFCAAVGFSSGGVPAELHFLINSTNMAPMEVSLAAFSDGTVKAKGVTTKYRERLPVKTFFDTYHPTAKVAPSSELKLNAGKPFIHPGHALGGMCCRVP
jgi:hypothetical protein